ncbi:MAG: hypothetical protein GOV01_02750 [Candidatus Altiarchaeota archaeon]|nr:hypothetical protein [Candidatus Altiarchaeota archaeon]
MLSIPADTSGSPRICPVCSCELDEHVCKKDKVKTFSLEGVAGKFIKLRSDIGPVSKSELIQFSKFGYDIRTDMSSITNKRGFVTDLGLYFQALEAVTEPKITVFSRDHRNGGDLIQEAFEKFAPSSKSETAVVFGPISTTVSPYIGSIFSFQEKRSVLAVHSTASHNPPNYNGLKAKAGEFKHNMFPGKFEFSNQLSSEEVIDHYVSWCTRFRPYEGELNADLNNGAGVTVFPKIAKYMFPRVKYFNDQLLPDFGGLKPEPSWFSGWTGFGLAFDGDADRAPFYLKSKMIFFSQFFSGMVKEGLVNEKKVLVDQRTPPTIIEFLKEHGLRVKEGMIGNTNQAVLSQKNNSFWFEENWHTGGYLVGDGRFHWDDALFAVPYWLEKLTVPIEKVLEGVPNFEYTEERFKVPVGFNQKILRRLEKLEVEYSELPGGGARIADEIGHILLRESNTEVGIAKIFVTGVDKSALKNKLEAGRKLVSSIEGHDFN